MDINNILSYLAGVLTNLTEEGQALVNLFVDINN
jgi:hypothetical protein